MALWIGKPYPDPRLLVSSLQIPTFVDLTGQRPESGHAGYCDSQYFVLSDSMELYGMSLAGLGWLTAWPLDVSQTQP
jgi:hypothetical protein